MKNYFLILLTLSLIISACGGDSKESAANSEEAKKEKTAKIFGLTTFELDNGIGPIKEKIKLGPTEPAKVAAGEKLFVSKCSQCHKLDEKYTGPALREVIKRRSPEYIMNMILNPQEMTARHPEAKKMLAQYLTPMTFQNVTQDDARSILEYFRTLAK